MTSGWSDIQKVYIFSFILLLLVTLFGNLHKYHKTLNPTGQNATINIDSIYI